jgi:acetyltransferase-like isoleucine patch superfamily enzyme
MTDKEFYPDRCRNNQSMTFGAFSYGSPRILTGGSARLSIGKFCSISDDVLIFLGGNHRPDWMTTYPFPAFPAQWPEAAGIEGHPATKGDVVIGHDVWIGFGATIMSGVTIGNGAVIGARSVVAKDVEPYAIVAGNPAREIRKRFTDEQIRILQEMQWWDWPIEKIRQNMKLLCAPPEDWSLVK